MVYVEMNCRREKDSIYEVNIWIERDFLIFLSVQVVLILVDNSRGDGVVSIVVLGGVLSFWVEVGFSQWFQVR